MKPERDSAPIVDRTRENEFKVKEGKFRLVIRKKLFTVEVVRHWKDCPGR